MSYKRISVRFNMDVDAERKVWEIIHEKGSGFVGKEVISAINTSRELSGLEKMIRKVVSEELKKALFIISMWSMFRLWRSRSSGPRGAKTNHLWEPSRKRLCR